MLEVRSNKCYPTFIKNIKVFMFTDIVVLWMYEAASICNTNLVGGPRHGSSRTLLIYTFPKYTRNGLGRPNHIGGREWCDGCEEHSHSLR